MKLFLQKNAKFSSAGGFASKQLPHCEFLATRLPAAIFLRRILNQHMYKQFNKFFSKSKN